MPSPYSNCSNQSKNVSNTVTRLILSPLASKFGGVCSGKVVTQRIKEEQKGVHVIYILVNLSPG